MTECLILPKFGKQNCLICLFLSLGLLNYMNVFCSVASAACANTTSLTRTLFTSSRNSLLACSRYTRHSLSFRRLNTMAELSSAKRIKLEDQTGRLVDSVEEGTNSTLLVDMPSLSQTEGGSSSVAADALPISGEVAVGIYAYVNPSIPPYTGTIKHRCILAWRQV